MNTFKGFPAGKAHLTPIPGSFFSELLPNIDHLGELKLTLYFIWRLNRMEGEFRYLRYEDIAQDESFMDGMGTEKAQGETALSEALARAIQRGTLLAAKVDLDQGEQTLYFLNTPRGRAAVQAIQAGEWRPTGDEHLPVNLAPESSNIFRLYEQNIGPLTPMIAEALGEAEDSYPPSWIEEAFRIAVENNARNWRYISAILTRWQEEGRDAQKDRRDSEKTRRKYVKDEFSDYIKH
jgi:DnaD/phage-associated family protein